MIHKKFFRLLLLFMPLSPILVWAVISTYFLLNMETILGSGSVLWNHTMVNVSIYGLIFVYITCGLYIMYLTKLSNLPQNKKIAWIFFLIVGNVLAMIIFWFIYIKDWRFNNLDT